MFPDSLPGRVARYPGRQRGYFRIGSNASFAPLGRITLGASGVWPAGV